MNQPTFGDAPGSSAVCPLHPNVAAVATCSRCGRFCCAPCLALQAPPTCAQCQARGRDAVGIGTQGMTVGGTLRLAFVLMRAAAPVVAVVVVLGAALGSTLELAFGELMSAAASRLVDRVYDLTVGTWLTVAVVAAYATAAEGRTLTAGQALREGLDAFGRVFRARFLSGLLIGVFLLLLIVPGVMKALSYSFVAVLAWKNVPDPLAASAELTAGRRGPLLGVLSVAFVVFLAVIAVPIISVELVTQALPGLATAGAVVNNLVVNFGERLLDAAVMGAYLLLTNEMALGRRAG